MPSSGRNLVVAKLGGSLLDWPELGGRLSEFLGSCSHPLLVVGGGPTADLVRHWDQQHNLRPESAHALAVRAMDFNAALLARLLPAGRIVRSSKQYAPLWSRAAVPIQDVGWFLRHHGRRSDEPLPANWEVTSDTIAAWIAVQLRASELLLLKSTDLPGDIGKRQDSDGRLEVDWQQAARRELVDPAFPVWGARIHVRWINLRSDVP